MMRNLALDMAGSDTYTKFIVLGRSRTGSNFCAACSMTIRKSRLTARFSATKRRWIGITSAVCRTINAPTAAQRPGEIGQRQVFRRYPKETAAVGFKIFYYHAQDPGWQAIWPYLLAQTDIHVIHMKRANILQTHLSRKRAELTDSWVNTGGEREKERLYSSTTTNAWPILNAPAPTKKNMTTSLPPIPKSN
ncbi:MAG: hypothetical protein H6662_19535 [Ardenticatenaceae bacterium]|nr:hypothetical protein [Ardenticatenaceae bacterium]